MLLPHLAHNTTTQVNIRASLCERTTKKGFVQSLFTSYGRFAYPILFIYSHYSLCIYLHTGSALNGHQPLTVILTVKLGGILRRTAGIFSNAASAEAGFKSDHIYKLETHADRGAYMFEDLRLTFSKISQSWHTAYLTALWPNLNHASVNV